MWQSKVLSITAYNRAGAPLKPVGLFLTLTVRNMPVCELRDALQHMNKSWQRLIKRKEFKAVQGWIRTTEITRGKDGSAHPHFHILLMVPPSWFRGKHTLNNSAGLSYGAIACKWTMRQPWTSGQSSQGMTGQAVQRLLNSFAVGLYQRRLNTLLNRRIW